MNRFRTFFLYTSLFLTSLYTPLSGGVRDSAPKVFIDGRHLDINYIRTNITFVNYVMDRKDADIHVLVTMQQTAAGGWEYTLKFIGRNQYEGQGNVLTYVSASTETRDDTRRGLTRILKLGLAPYMASTPLAQSMSLKFTDKAGPGSKNALSSMTDKDPWDHWVFSLRADTRMSGEKSQTSHSVSGSVTADRITDDTKFRLRASHWEEVVKYDYEDYKVEETSYRSEVTGLWVKSVNEHWSFGSWLSFYRSSYGNISGEYSAMPAVEYNFFPYSESTRHQLRLLYRLGYSAVQYEDSTIYNETGQQLFSEALTASFEVNEPWGYGYFSLEGRHYFHDLDMRRLTFNGRLSIRLFKGLSLDIRGRYSATQDQLALRKEDTSLEELLLQRKELASNYHYELSFGIGYRFGSIFSNVVNPRFGSSNRTPIH